ncbi:TauD/TfdA family dioxygenase [Pseudomaricurvus sp. HS19]|uniref:TauD/TfdA dioxygenase family protein n=1 Tax=Pseudomaricurvus sp. HS19 TaxID=2692626 RepID=UPI00136F1FDE|nr:TauD/TfdA family dioxygenase [Pseudomaricurvus sp. HS19]MYM62378.1 TauD/TfdA family dioxygenase [Pseudomaricurvus sp. HS19]
MALETKEIKPQIGTEIHASKEVLLSGEYASQIRDLLEQRGVLVFPKVGFTDAEQVEFTKTLGKFAPEIAHGGNLDDANPGEGIHKITLDASQTGAADYLKGSMYWHIDGTMNTVPILASLLSAQYMPPEGGQTDFCNTYAAYDELSDEEKEDYDDLRVLHAAWASLFYYNPEPVQPHLEAMMNIGDAELPLVWEHKSGRKSLVLGCTAYAVEGKSVKEGTRLLNKLREWATQERFSYTHDWSVGDLVIWDNTGTMHRAKPYDPASGRLLHRTKLEGEEPII